MQMLTQSDGPLIETIAEFCRRNAMAESTFGRRSVNDGKFVGRLKYGGRVTTATVERVRAFMSNADKAQAPNGREMDSAFQLSGFDSAVAAESAAAAPAAEHAESGEDYGSSDDEGTVCSKFGEMDYVKIGKFFWVKS